MPRRPPTARRRCSPTTRWSNWPRAATAKIRRRRVPLSEFVVGPGKTALEDDELLVSIECDALPGWGGAFEKVGHRRSLVISVVCLAVLVKPDETGTRFAAARVAIGGIGPVPERLSEVEAFLKPARRCRPT
jgi:xanthine dehydrogenase FAD-binding subunit